MNRQKIEIKNRNTQLIPWLFLALIIFMLSAATLFSVLPKSFAAQVTMEVFQQKDGKVFSQETETILDIFNDPKLGGQKLVHPFSRGSYSFVVYNNSNSDPLPYSLNIWSINSENIPLVFSLQKNGVYILGGAADSSMLPLSQFNFPETLLSGRASDVFTFTWRWETTSDVIDTAIGNIGTQLYTIKIKATGTIPDDLPATPNPTPPVSPTWPWWFIGGNNDPSKPAEPTPGLPDVTYPNDNNNSNDNSQPDPTPVHPPVITYPPDTGESSNLLFVWITVLAVCIIILFVLLFFKRKKDDDEEKPTDSENN